MFFRCCGASILYLPPLSFLLLPHLVLELLDKLHDDRLVPSLLHTFNYLINHLHLLSQQFHDPLLNGITVHVSDHIVAVDCVQIRQPTVCSTFCLFVTCWCPEQIVERSEEHTSELQSRENLVCR